MTPRSRGIGIGDGGTACVCEELMTIMRND